MKLFEYQSMTMFRDYSIPVPRGELASSPDEAASITGRFGGRSVIKAQVLSGGRGKAGGVKLANSPEEARKYAAEILALSIQGMPVGRVLVSEQVTIKHEYYVSVAVNRDAGHVECVFSEAGGIDIEDAARISPDRILHVPADPVLGISEILLNRELEPHINTAGLRGQAVSIVQKMYRIVMEKDCMMIEINPLASTDENRFIAVDAKIIIDDNALFRHPELETMRNPEESSIDEIDARRAGLSFVSLDGTIGCMVNGAGLAMATMDLIKHYGGEPANFLDVGGSSNPQKVIDAVSILLRNRKLRAILMNIFGGITRCDDIARGVIQARKSIDIPVPFIIRLIGTNDAAARDILKHEGLYAYTDLSEAVLSAVEAAGKER